MVGAYARVLDAPRAGAGDQRRVDQHVIDVAGVAEEHVRIALRRRRRG